jgi:hypothetical protein
LIEVLNHLFVHLRLKPVPSVPLHLPIHFHTLYHIVRRNL